MSELPTSAPRPSGMSPLLFAIYLGASWTWCIGMFMPVLLIRDYGPWAWVVFAVPNVVGAAAMGWVLKDAEASRRMAWRHEGMGIVFSIVTIAFHVFFLAWKVAPWIGPRTFPVAGGMVAVVLIAGMLERRSDPWMAALVWVASLAAGAFALARGAISLPPGWEHANLPAITSMAPVFVLGFLLCPYLDLTFHRARQSTSPSGGKWAFGFGFGFVFLSMIVLTLLYASHLGSAAGWLRRLIAVHWLTQASLTVALHGREVARRFTAVPRWTTPLIACFLAAAYLGGRLAVNHGPIAGRPAGEVIYWSFLAFYATLFPAYVLIRMGRPDGSKNATLRKMTITLALSAVAVVPMWIGFVQGQIVWAPAGAGLILFTWIVWRLSSVRVHDSSSVAK